MFDIVKGHSGRDLESYFKALDGKERVRVVCIDLSSSYRALVKRYFPNATIVADGKEELMDFEILKITG